MTLGFGYGARAHPRSRNQFVSLTIEDDYLWGTDLDAVLSDFTPDIVDPADREAQVIDLPPLTPDQRARIMDEHQRELIAPSEAP